MQLKIKNQTILFLLTFSNVVAAWMITTVWMTLHHFMTVISSSSSFHPTQTHNLDTSIFYIFFLFFCSFFLFLCFPFSSFFFLSPITLLFASTQHHVIFFASCLQYSIDFVPLQKLLPYSVSHYKRMTFVISGELPK